MGSMRQWESPWQQKNAAIPAGMEPQWQQKNAAFLVEQKPETWEEKWEKEISQWGRRASSGVHETHEEFSCKFRHTLQEFTMLLTKKFHYEFPVEYFDDYQGNLNKEEFLGMEQSKEELRWWKVDSLPISNIEKKKYAGLGKSDMEGDDNDSVGSNNRDSGGLIQDVWALEKNSTAIIEELKVEVTEEVETNTSTQVASVRTERLDGEDQNFVSNGIDVGVFQDTVLLPLNLYKTENSVDKQSAKHVGEGGWKKGHMAAMEEPLAGIDVAAAPHPTAYRQPWSENPRQVYYSLLLHFQDDVDEFVAELGCGVNEEVNDRILRLEADAALFALVQSVVKTCGFVPVEYLRKKKKPRRRKREKEVKQKMKVGVG